MTDNIDAIFDMQPIEVVHEDETVTIIPADGVEEDVDYEFARNNHYLLAQQVSEAITLAMKVAKGSQHPAAIKELANMLKAASEINRQLLILSKDKAEAKAAKKTPSAIQENNTTEQIVFTGTSSDINKFLSEKKDADV